ncbi:TIGR03084 family metal-binding protein [soil metagenome]
MLGGLNDTMRELIEDLEAEQADLDRILVGLADDDWDRPTPAVPWTIRDTVSHLAFFDERQTQSIEDPAGFAAEVNQRLTGDYDKYMAIGFERGRAMSPSQLLDWWRHARAKELAALATVEPDARLAWYGPPLRAGNAAIARLMETWAHGQDIVDALELSRAPTIRLFRIAELGVKTFSWSFANRGLDAPDRKVRVALRGEGGRTEVWNDDQDDSVTGPVEEFCLVVAQRINYRDTHLVIEGEVAKQWMEVAQIFAGPPGPGRPAREDEFPIYRSAHPATDVSLRNVEPPATSPPINGIQ